MSRGKLSQAMLTVSHLKIHKISKHGYKYQQFLLLPIPQNNKCVKNLQGRNEAESTKKLRKKIRTIKTLWLQDDGLTAPDAITRPPTKAKFTPYQPNPHHAL